MAVNQSIAFVANTSWSIYKFRLYLIERLLRQGFAIYVLAPRDPYTEKFEHLIGLTYIELTHFHGKSISPLEDYLLYRELLSHYRTLKPRLIFHYTVKANLYGTRAAARAGIPSISVITGLGYTFSGEGWLQHAVRTAYRRQLQKSSEVWFLNSDDREFFITRGLVRPEKTFLLPGEGVDAAYFYPAPYQQRTEITFLLIGRLIRHKGIYEFVAAARSLQKQGLAVRCQLLGFFDDNNPVAIPRKEIEEWTARNLVTWLGHTDDVRPFIEQADCVVLPSYREGMPLSLLEGASMCKALIATDTAGCRAIVEEGVNGYLCREKDGADLAQKMVAYYHLPPMAKRQMGIEGRNQVLQHYTRERVVAIYLEKISILRGHE
ncbi:glycosyltransferase family 4 protein [Puia dinghuensis]|uniref:Glycosyl transferase n=1 Tax=Puia dinghuensis TaxID=1792502 RepID=A0A8J2UJ56_9BACT|nr:glycosyltransferase family 4 protein [Puia dinghuensis]GGB25651.1 glycosyl transferase [Puia dinghuensis]